MDEEGAIDQISGGRTLRSATPLRACSQPAPKALDLRQSLAMNARTTSAASDAWRVRCVWGAYVHPPSAVVSAVARGVSRLSACASASCNAASSLAAASAGEGSGSLAGTLDPDVTQNGGS